MNHLVFLDAEAGDLEKILSGIKCVVVSDYDASLPPEAEVSPGDGLFFLRDNDECIVRVRATAVRSWLFEETAEEDLAHQLKELQTRLQLTEDQYNHWSTRRQARFVEFEAAEKIQEFYIAPEKITDRTRWMVLEEEGPVTQEGVENGTGSHFAG